MIPLKKKPRFAPNYVAGIELVVRGVLVRRNQALLVRSRSARHTFLPGGHIEFGEPAAAALRREIREELGFSARVIRFLGTVEHAWTADGNRSHEVCLVFQVDFDCPAPGQAVRSREKKIEFFWKGLDELEQARLEPRVLRRLLPRWLEKAGAGHWGSTMERPRGGRRRWR